MSLASPVGVGYNIRACDGHETTALADYLCRGQEGAKFSWPSCDLLKTGHGDLCLAEWDTKHEETVDHARRAFDENFTAGRMAFRLDGPGQTRDPRVRRDRAGDPARAGDPGGRFCWPPMIRTGYLRWEIEADDVKSAVDPRAREIVLRARPSYRVLLVKNTGQQVAAERFVRGEANYDDVLRIKNRPAADVEVTVPDVGPHVFRYSEADRVQTPRFWMEKVQREVSAFAHEVVRSAAKFPQLVIENAALRAGYAKLVEFETFRVIEGRSKPGPTRDDEPMKVEVVGQGAGVPELVAAELVRDVVEPKEFDEFCRFDRVTIENGNRYYRIPRRPHALIEVWDARSLRGEARLCVVFQDPGMPPSDEVVMKYLLAKHQPDMLWQVGVKFAPPTGKFDGAAPRRWKSE